MRRGARKEEVRAEDKRKDQAHAEEKRKKEALARFLLSEKKRPKKNAREERR